MLVSVVFAMLLACAGCAHDEAPGSYAAANKAQCLPANLVLLDQAGKKGSARFAARDAGAG